MTQKTLENPVFKERLTFLATGAETGGEVFRAELVVGPGGGASLPHVHPHQEERWEIRAGEAQFRLGNEERLVGPGDTVVAPPGVTHAFSNCGNDDLSMTLELRPALRSAALFETICGLAARGALDAKGRPSPLFGLALGREFRDEAALPHIPLAVQRAFLAVLGPLTHLTGHSKRLAHSAL